MRREITVEENDPEGENPFDYDYGGGDWGEDYITEVAKSQRPRGPDERNYTLMNLKENCLFDNYRRMPKSWRTSRRPSYFKRNFRRPWYPMTTM
jgi:hypothetical protein